MNAGDALVNRAENPKIVVSLEFRVQAALQADFGGPSVPRLFGAGGNLLEREKFRFRVVAPLGKGAETASGVANIGEVDVPDDDEGDRLARLPAAELVRGGEQGIKLRRFGLE